MHNPNGIRMFLENSVITVKSYKPLHVYQEEKRWAGCIVSYNGTQLRSEIKWLTDTYQHGWIYTLCWRKEASPKGMHSVGSHLYEPLGINKIIYDDRCKKTVGSGLREYFISTVSCI